MIKSNGMHQHHFPN